MIQWFRRSHTAIYTTFGMKTDSRIVMQATEWGVLAGVGTLDALAQDMAQILQNNGREDARHAFDRNETPLGSIVISGTGLGLPGAEKPVMDPDNALRILRGEQFVDLIPERFRNQIVNKRITRLVKGAVRGSRRPGAFRREVAILAGAHSGRGQ